MENQFPSGYDVESASLHVPVDTKKSSGLKGKLSSLRGACSTKLSTMKSTSSEKLSSMKASVSNRVTAMRSGLDSSMRGNPAKWAGIAAGAGFALGLGGRLMRSRMKSRRMVDLIIIEGAC